MATPYRPLYALVGLSILLLVTERARAEPIAIVASAQWTQAHEIALSDLRAIYLGHRTWWLGKRVRRIDLPSGSRVRAGFSVSVLGRTEIALERYWIEQALTGGSVPPFQVAAAFDVLRSVREHVGTLGYVRWSALRSADLQGIRVLRVISRVGSRLANEPDYPIHTIADTPRVVN